MSLENMSPDEAAFFAISQIIQPTKLTPSGFLAVSVVLVVMVAATSSLRIWANYNHAGRVFLDDYLCVVAFAFLIWNVVVFYLLVAAMNMDARDVTINWFTPRCALGIFAGNMALYTAKLPLLFLYIRTFSIIKWLRYTCITLVVVGGLGFVSTATYASVTCSPQIHGHEFPPVFFGGCIMGITNACLARASVSLTMDLVMFFLPLPVIKNLKLPFRRKAGLALVFMAGLLAITASAVGLYFQNAQTGGSSDNFANALIFTVIESAIVILVSCAPSLHLFWTKQAGRLRARLGLTRLSTKASEPRSGHSESRLSKRRGDFSPFGTDNANGSIQVRTDHYIELSDPTSLAYKHPGSQTKISASRNFN